MKRAAEKLFHFPRAYRAKFIVTGALLAVARATVLKRSVSIDEVVRAAQLPPGASICEIGCGDGENFSTLTSSAGTIRYTGIDINPAMIAHCTQRFEGAAWLCAGSPYPFPDRHFDVCLIANVLHHLNSDAEAAAMLAEAGRVAERVLLFEPLQSEEAPLRALKRAYWLLTDGGFHYLRLAEFHALFAAAGLQLTWERHSAPLRQFYGAHLTASKKPSSAAEAT